MVVCLCDFLCFGGVRAKILIRTHSISMIILVFNYP